MRIVDLLKKQSIDLNASVADKAAAIDHLVDLMAAGGNLNDKELYKQRVLAREQEGSTGIGEGIAIPHAKTEAVNEPGLASMIVRDGVDYESLDDEPAHLFFLIAAPAGGANVHLEVLSRLSRMLMDDDFRDNLMKAKTPEEYLAIIGTGRSRRSRSCRRSRCRRSTGRTGKDSSVGSSLCHRRYSLPDGHCPYLHGGRSLGK